ncbi:BTAD domain-containing putative transcriptional regulator [Streptomyces monticola]|uniref:BTAD domain-containing putative transcriptional regulator n=1 Tax=Streptomyces monticola TaxID=2666263 RepID=A0ABW2JHD2_9ACTN
MPTSPARITVSLLGPVTAATGGGGLAICGERQRRLLASLALSLGEVVPVERLVKDIWGDEPPRTASGQLQTAMWRLRRALEPADADRTAFVTYPAGYQLDRSACTSDVAEFRTKAAEAKELHREGLREPAVERWEEALALWRGPALADVSGSALRARATRLEEERLAALEQRISLEVELGRHARVIGELSDLVAQHPFRESLHAELMLALYQAGRQAEALAAFRRVRALLDQELGISPGARLVELERAILRQDRALLPAPASC